MARHAGDTRPDVRLHCMNSGLSPPPDNRRDLTSATPPTNGPVLTQRDSCLHLLGRVFLRGHLGQCRVTDEARAEVRCVRVHRREVEADGTVAFLVQVAADREFVGRMLTARRGDVVCLSCASCVSRGWNRQRADPCGRCAVQRWIPVVPTAPLSWQSSNKSRARRVIRSGMPRCTAADRWAGVG